LSKEEKDKIINSNKEAMEMWEAWDEDKKTVLESSFKNNSERNRYFLTLQSKRSNVNMMWLYMMLVEPELTHEAIRPKDSEYNRRYYLDNIDAFQNERWQPGHINHRCIDGYIQENDSIIDDIVIYLVYDCHYYLKDWTPANVKSLDRFEAVGANFFHVPGRYVLPFREGIYHVTSDA